MTRNHNSVDVINLRKLTKMDRLTILINPTSFDNWCDVEAAEAFLKAQFCTISALTIADVPCIVRGGHVVPNQGWEVQTNRGKLQCAQGKMQFLAKDEQQLLSPASGVLDHSPPSVFSVTPQELRFGHESDEPDSDDEENGIEATFVKQVLAEGLEDCDIEEEKEEQQTAVFSRYRPSSSSSSFQQQAENSNSSAVSMWEPGFQWQNPFGSSSSNGAMVFG